MQFRNLLPQNDMNSEQRLDDRRQIPVTLDQFPDARRELTGAYLAYLKTEIAQRAAKVVLDITGLGLQQLPTGEQHWALLARQRPLRAPVGRVRPASSERCRGHHCGRSC